MAVLTSPAASQPQPVHQSVVGDLRGVRDEREDRVARDRRRSPPRSGHQRRPHRLALAVDLRVVAAREIDPLERAGRQLARLPEASRRAARRRVDHDRGPAREPLPCTSLQSVEHRHQRHPLGGEGDHLVGLEMKARPDPVRIAHHEHVAVADRPADRVAAVPWPPRTRITAAGSRSSRSSVWHLRSGHPRVAEPAVEIGVGLVEVEADLLEHRLGVGPEDRVLAALDQRSG